MRIKERDRTRRQGEEKMTYRFIVTGGGTSGHINPAITIADSLRRFYSAKGDTCEIIFTGRSAGLEGELVPQAGYELRSITAKPFPMRPGMKMVKAYKALREGRKQCASIIDEFAPDAVIGTGGYVCAPLLMEASAKKVPVIIHESNAFPGRANRMLGKKADLVLTGFPDLEKVFAKAGRVVYTGNPIRSIMFGNTKAGARANLGIASDSKLVFVMGGSLGSKTLNDFALEAASDPELSDVHFVLSAGKQQSTHLSMSNIPANLEVREYINNTNDYLAGADICITRSGAVTCAESAAIGTCSIFVPYPHAAQDHQTYNARAFENVDGGIVVSDAEAVEGRLLQEVKALLKDPDRRARMSANATKLAVNDCDSRIVGAIDELIGKK